MSCALCSLTYLRLIVSYNASCLAWLRRGRPLHVMRVVWFDVVTDDRGMRCVFRSLSMPHMFGPSCVCFEAYCLSGRSVCVICLT